MSGYLDANIGFGRRHRMHRRRGRGIIDTLKKVHGHIKKSGIVSALASQLRREWGHKAHALGYGKRRRVRRRGLGRRVRRRGGSDSLFTKYLLGHGRKRVRRHGRGWLSDFGNGIVDGLKMGHDFIKSNGLVSKGLALTGNPALGAAAGLFGYGRRRRVHRRRIGGMSAVKLAVMRSVLGQGKRRRIRRRR